MSVNRDDARNAFFDNLFNETTPAAEDIKALRQLAYEERVIKRVFKECGVAPSSWGPLARDCRDKTDQVKLNFNWFNATYSRFPCQLVGKRIPFLHKVTLVDLFKPAAKNRIVRAISKALVEKDINAATDNYLLVFPIIRTPFCAHSLMRVGIEPPETDQRIQVLIRVSGVVKPMIIEPLKSFGNALGGEWFSA